MKGKILLFICLMLAGTAVYADCQSGEQTYPEGKVIGPYTCTNGQWIRK